MELSTINPVVVNIDVSVINSNFQMIQSVFKSIFQRLNSLEIAKNLQSEFPQKSFPSKNVGTSAIIGNSSRNAFNPISQNQESHLQQLPGEVKQLKTIRSFAKKQNAFESTETSKQNIEYSKKLIKRKSNVLKMQQNRDQGQINIDLSLTNKNQVISNVEYQGLQRQNPRTEKLQNPQIRQLKQEIIDQRGLILMLQQKIELLISETSQKNGMVSAQGSAEVQSLNKQINHIRDYLSGKVKAISAKFETVDLKLTSYDSQLKQLENKVIGQIDNLRDKANEIQTKQKQAEVQIIETKRDTATYNDRIQKLTKQSPHHSILKTQDCLQTTAFTQATSNVGFYEDKIIEIFQELEKLKDAYLDVSIKLKQEEQNISQLQEGNDKKISDDLALKFQKAFGNDEKVKRQINLWVREVKKLRSQFDTLLVGVNAGTNQKRTIVIKPNETKQDWKSLSQKIYKLKLDVQNQVKDLQSKIVTNNEAFTAISEMQKEIGECKIFINRKIDTVEYEKNIKKIEARLNNFIRQVFEKEDRNTDGDAMIARQPWFCLSCDTQLKNYPSKTGKSAYETAKFPSKKLNTQLHTVRRNQNGRFPSIQS